MADDQNPPADPPKDPPAPEPKPDDADAMKAALRKANKEAEDSRKRVKELEDAGKSESERTTQRAIDAEARANAAEAKALRYEVGAAKGLTPKQAARLVGNTAEELEADADELLATFPAPGAGTPPPPPTPPPSSGKPREALRPGTGDPLAEPEETDLKKLGERMFAG